MKLISPTPFPLTLQCEYSERIKDFQDILSTLHSCGFYGIELNLPDLELCPPTRMLTVLKENKLELTYLATGAYAKKYGLSLSASDAVLRNAAITGCKENVDYASEIGSGIIIGFMKSASEDTAKDAEVHLIQSLIEVMEYARKQKVTVLLEATNRYEAKVANSLEQAVKIAKEVRSPFLKILPDTYHMNIEESRPYDVLNKYMNWIPNIHLSDNNRFFPGYGCVDFGKYFELLLALGYTGTVGVEGNWKCGMEKDIKRTATYLKRVTDSIWTKQKSLYECS